MSSLPKRTGRKAPERMAAPLILLLVAVVAVSLLTVSPTGAQGRAVGFFLTDLDGRHFRFDPNRTGTVLLIFGTTWCPSCRAEIPRFKEIHHRYAGRGLEVVYIDIMESRDKVRRFAERHRLPYRTLLDETGSVAESYGVRGVPAMILIRDGAVVTRRYEAVEAHLGRLFGP